MSSDESLMDPEEPGAWTQFGGPTRTQAQLDELCTLMGDMKLGDKETALKFFNVEHWDISDQARLLEAFQKSKMNSKKSERFQRTKYVLYSVLWNYMAEFSKEMSAKKAVEVVSIALQWLLSESVRNLDKIGTKLNKLTTMAQRCEERSVVKQLVMDLAKAYPAVLKWESGGSQTGLELCRTNSGVFFGLVNFTFGSMLLMLQAREIESAFKVAQSLLVSSKSYFRTRELNTLAKCIELAQLSYHGIFIHTGEVELAVILKEFRSKTLVGYKTPGMSMTLLSAYFQFLNSAPNFESTTCKGITDIGFVRLIGEFCLLLTSYGTCSEHESLSISIPEQCEIVVNFVVFLLQLIASNVAVRVATDGSLMLLVKRCTGLLDFVLPKTKNVGFRAEVHARLANSFAALAAEFQKVNGTAAALEVYQHAVNSYYKLAEFPENKVDPMPYAMLMAEACYKRKDYTAGLFVIARWIVRAPTVLETQICSYDIFDERRYNDWGYQWIRFKADSKDEEVMNLSMWECLKDDPSYEKLMAKALRLEINTYLTNRAVYAEALINAGEHLEDHAECATDSALGLLAQVIGFWWGDDSNEGYCVRTCEDIVAQLNDAARDEKENPLISILAGVAKGWLGITYLRTLQTRAMEDFQFSKENAVKEERDRDGDNDEEITSVNDRIVPVLTSITINNEAEVATDIIFCIDTLYTMLQFEEDVVKSWIDVLVPGLIMTTARMCALQMNCYGDTYNSIRAWHVVNFLSRLYKRKYLQLFSGMELYRLMPQSIKDLVNKLDELNEEGQKLKHVNASYFARLSLTKAVVCLKNEMYQEGIDHLAEALKLRTTTGLNLDSYHLIMAESYLILAQYKDLPEEAQPNFGSIAETLSSMTPAGIVNKALKLFSGISRKPNPKASGWADMFHNSHLLSVLVSMVPAGLEMLIEGGRVKEAKCFAADAIFLCQQMGLVTRTFEMLFPIAEMEIPALALDSCHVMIDGIDKRLSCEMDCGITRAELVFKELMPLINKLEIPLKNPMRLLRASPQTWSLMPVNLPSYRYPRRGGRDEAFKDKTGFLERLYGVPKLLLHPLICHCYVCVSPIIISLALRFLFLQAKYAIAGSPPKKALTIISLARVQHQRAMFRILFHMERMCARLAQAFHAKKMGRSALEFSYFPFFYQPSVDAIQTLMEVTPASDLHFILECLNHLKEGELLVNDPHPFNSLKPLEAAVSAVFETQFIEGKIPITNGEIREIIQKAFETNKPELPLNCPVPLTPQREIHLPLNPPKVVHKKKKNA